MKLTIVGGGGFRVPLIYKALLADVSPNRVTELRLLDTDDRRLSAITAVLAELARDYPAAPRVVSTKDPREALSGTDFVFSAIRVGGPEGRATDERIALSHGIIGQETVGAGGISYALRGIPQVLELGNQILDYAPEAWVMNFTNPAGIMTEVLRGLLGDRVVGICDSPVGLARRVLGVLAGAGLVADDLPDPSVGNGRIALGYLGLNHFGWLSSLHVDGRDVLPLLLERPDLIGGFEEGRLFGAPLIRSLGAVPNEYLHYYYYSRDDLLADQAANQTRGVFLAEQQGRFYRRAQQSGCCVLDLWEATRLEREETYMATNREAAGSFERDQTDLETGGYDKVALAVMHAVANDVPANLILNVANRGIIPELDDDAVIEVPCRVDGSGVHPVRDLSLPEHARGLVINAKYVERKTISAVLNASRDDALLALLHHPLVDSYSIAEKFLSDVIDAHQLNYLKENAGA